MFLFACVFLGAWSAAAGFEKLTPGEPWNTYFAESKDRTFHAQVGKPFAMRWWVPTYLPYDIYSAFCVYRPFGKNVPEKNFTVAYRGSAGATIARSPFGSRARIVTPPMLESYLVIEINPVKCKDAGKYSCAVETGRAVAEGMYRLHVGPRPSAPPIIKKSKNKLIKRCPIKRS